MVINLFSQPKMKWEEILLLFSLQLLHYYVLLLWLLLLHSRYCWCCATVGAVRPDPFRYLLFVQNDRAHSGIWTAASSTKLLAALGTRSQLKICCDFLCHLLLLLHLRMAQIYTYSMRQLQLASLVIYVSLAHISLSSSFTTFLCRFSPRFFRFSSLYWRQITLIQFVEVLLQVTRDRTHEW